MLGVVPKRMGVYLKQTLVQHYCIYAVILIMIIEVVCQKIKARLFCQSYTEYDQGNIKATFSDFSGSRLRVEFLLSTSFS